MWDFEVDGDQMTFEASSQNQTLPVLAFRLSSPKSARARAHHSEFGSPDSSSVRKPIDLCGSFGRIPSTLGLLRISGRHKLQDELCQTPLAACMDFVAKHSVPPHYGTASRTSMKSARLLTVSKRDRRSRFIAACYSDQAW